VYFRKRNREQAAAVFRRVPDETDDSPFNEGWRFGVACGSAWVLGWIVFMLCLLFGELACGLLRLW
jgi:hypothetical protein